MNQNFLQRECVMRITEKFYRFVFSSVACAGLVACGGGGGNANINPNTTDTSGVGLSGVAYKGILKNAEVSAYEVVNGIISNTPLQTVSTGADGSYTFNMSAP